MKQRPPPLQLTNPTTARPKCRACGKEVKDMGRHAGTAACVNAARRALIDRLELVEVWFREKQVLTEGHVPVTVIRDSKGQGRKRRWYAAPEPVAALRALMEGGMDGKRISPLLRGPKEELEREVALVALGGRRDERHEATRSVFMAQSVLETSRFGR